LQGGGHAAFPNFDAPVAAWNNCTKISELHLKYSSKKLAELLLLGSTKNMQKPDLDAMLTYIQKETGHWDSAV